jgi:hypothetical protein
MTQANRIIEEIEEIEELSSCCLVNVSWTGCQALTLGEGMEDREGEQERERERERESEREGEVPPEWVPKSRHPRLGLPFVKNAQPVSQASLC